MAYYREEGREGREERKGRSGRDGRSGRGRIFRKGKCKFCESADIKIDYLDFQGLRRFTTERGKILPSRITGNCAKHQRQISKAVKRSREAGLMPYIAD